VDIRDFEKKEKFLFWVNLYNVLALHGGIHMGPILNWKTFFTEIKYNIQGQEYSLNDIEHGMLRANSVDPSSWLGKSQFEETDTRLLYGLEHPDPHIHFFLTCNTVDSPPLVVLTLPNFYEEMRLASRNFCETNILINEHQIMLPKVFYWYRNDFGKSDMEILVFLMQYVTSQLSVLNRLLQKSIIFKYKGYDWGFRFPSTFTPNLET